MTGIAPRRRTGTALAGVAIGLTDPVGDALRRWLELPRSLFRRSPRSGKLDHLPLEFRRIGGSKAPHRALQKITSKVATKPGQFHFVEKLSKSALTGERCAAYKPAIETAPPVSGASSALPERLGLMSGVPGEFLS